MTNKFPFRSSLAFAGALALAVPLAACSSSEDDAASQEVGNETLASALADGSDIDMVSDALKDTGLAQVFDGTAAYTVLAPTDEAFAVLEPQEGEDTDEESRRAIVAAVLREHVLPGALSPTDIENAITAQGGPVTIRTMGEGTIKFAMDGETLTITDEEGESASMVGDPILASNGVVIPIDTVLKQP